MAGFGASQYNYLDFAGSAVPWGLMTLSGPARSPLAAADRSTCGFLQFKYVP
jgi:hypothetical protein